MEEEMTVPGDAFSLGVSRVDTLAQDVAALLRARTFEPGEIIGARYKLLEPLGVGGMGQVFIAENLAIGLRVAVKVLKPELLLDPTFRKRFQQEAQAIASIQHQHVVRFLDLIVGDPTFLVMEYLAGPALDQVLFEERRLAPARVIAIARRLC